jgi:hypothetical protein
MPWIQLRVNSTEKQAEQVSDMLMSWGAQAVSFVDAKDTPIYEPLPGEVLYWENTVVVGLFDAEHKMDKVVRQLEKAAIFKNGVQYKLEQLEDKDWEREWMGLPKLARHSRPNGSKRDARPWLGFWYWYSPYDCALYGMAGWTGIVAKFSGRFWLWLRHFRYCCIKAWR